MLRSRHKCSARKTRSIDNPRLGECSLPKALEVMRQERERVACRHQSPFDDFKSRLPREEGDVGQPDRADEDQAALVTLKTFSAAEAEQAHSVDGGASFFAYLAAKGLFPRLLTLGPAGGKVPSVAVLRDEHEVLICRHANAGRAVSLPFRRGIAEMPRRSPPLAGGFKLEGFAILEHG